MGKWMTQQEFEKKANIIHNNKYDYSKSCYLGSYKKILIGCPIHGDFYQTPNSHLQGEGCNKCSKKYKPTTLEFIAKAIEVHGKKYDYSKTIYTSNKSSVIITCKIHGDFKQIARNHLQGSGCPLCRYQRYSERMTFSTEQFVSKCKMLHGNKYDYSLVKYKGCRLPVSIVCKKHGVFQQRPIDHINGSGCPKCSESKGELRIQKWLEEHNINYVSQKRFCDLIDIKELSYDFYLPNQNILIEFNGEQHYKKNNFFHKDLKSLERQKYHDALKALYAKTNNIKLIVIPYNKIDSVESILKLNVRKTNYTKYTIFTDENGIFYFDIECKYEQKEKEVMFEKKANILLCNFLQDRNIKAMKI